MRRRSQRVVRNVCSGGSGRVKQSVTIDSLFMSDFYEHLNRLKGRSSPPLCHIDIKPNGNAKRMVQTFTLVLKINVTDADQKNCNGYAERLTFALNTSQDRIRGDTPFYLNHEWYPRWTLEATIPLRNTKRRDVEPQRWRYYICSQHQRARAAVNGLLKAAIQDRAER